MNTMPCSATAALAQYETSQDMNREEENAQLANDAERIRVRANEIQLEDGFYWDAMGDISENFFIAAMMLCDMDSPDGATCTVVGKAVLEAIRDAANRQARKELGL